MSINFLLTSNGASFSASSTLMTGDGRNWFASYAGDGIENADWMSVGGVWHSGTSGISSGSPQYLVGEFGQSRTINKLVFVTAGAVYNNPNYTNATTTFTHFGLTDYKLQYWDGAAWTDIPGASVTGNNQVSRTFTFSNITTTKVRAVCTGSSDGFARSQEFKAYYDDIEPPTGLITYPINGATISDAINVLASLADNVNLASVQLKLDATLLGSPITVSGTSASVSIPFDTAFLGEGTSTHYLRLVITDAAGNVYETPDAVQITVDNPITITSPFDYKLRWCARYFKYKPEYAYEKRKYQDDGVSFNELSDTPTLKWEIVYDGIDTRTESFHKSLDVFYENYRDTRPFTFIGKEGPYTNVYFLEYEPSHEKHQSYLQTRRLVLIRYP